jgi:signal transduction histidine kinase
MHRWHASTRFLQIGFLVLMAICAAQVGWWVYDQWLFTNEMSRRLEEHFHRDMRVAHELLKMGLPVEQVVALFQEMRPVEATSSGEIMIAPESLEALHAEGHRRLRRYMFEGGFFLVVLVGGMGVLSQALRTERNLRRRQENFLASVGHEFKSPLAGLRLAAETLSYRDPPPEGRRKLVGRILDELQRIEGMVTNLLDTAHIEEGRLALHPEPLEVAEVVRGALAGVEEAARSSGVEISANVPKELAILADRQAIAAVLRNLLTNAVAAVVRAGGGKVTITAWPRGSRTEIEVRDTGDGFDSKLREKLFDKFYRPGDEMRRGGKGSGLGLYIVRQLVERSGGQVTAQSDGPGHGAVFTVAWPAPRSAPHAAEEIPA